MRRVRVLLVEPADSDAPVEFLLADVTDVTVIGRSKPSDAVRAITAETPDVVVVNMPGGTGVETVEAIMGYAPVPILAVTEAEEAEDSAAAVGMLVAGAADVVPRPDPGDTAATGELATRLRRLRGVHVVRHPRARLSRPAERSTAPPVVGVAASTGGPPALATVLGGLADLPAAILVVQHLHHDFVAGFAAWLASETGLAASVAERGQRVQAGAVHVAPGGRHLKVTSGGRIVLDEQPPSLHRPSADELFRSLASGFGSRSIGVILTGMGSDGADGLLAMREAGAATFAQDRASCAVFGMPAVAVERGAAGQVVALTGMAAAIRRAVRGVAA